MPNILDAIIIIIVAFAAITGARRGTIKQAGGLVGAVVGIFAAAYTYTLLAFLTENSSVKALVLIVLLGAITYLLYDIFSTIAGKIQTYSFFKKFVGSLFDRIGSSTLAALNCLALLWLVSILISPLLPSTVQTATGQSLLLSSISEKIKPPDLVLNVERLLKPFASPTIFAESEPVVNGDVTASSVGSSEKQAAASASVVKIHTWGCGSLGSASGFVVSKNTILTNAHAIAGADRVSVQSQNGDVLVARAVWFDPLLDIAILTVDTALSTPPLAVEEQALAIGSPGVVMGFPGGGDFAANSATILGNINAEGYDIYQKQKTVRRLYTIRGDVVPGNSGGPLIDINGRVAGVIIGHSTIREHTGYAIIADQITNALKTHDPAISVGVGPCVGV